jgi:membrane associated rhomboid family serine protease
MWTDIRNFIYAIRYPLLLILIIWIIEIVDRWLALDLGRFGILPRTTEGLFGIIASPFLHGEWNHILNNTFSLLATTSIIATLYPRVAAQSFITITIGTGLGVWLWARDAYHIGASGVIYGLVSFIFWTGLFKKNPKSIMLSLLVLSLYGGMFEAIFPNVAKDISWESHLSGGIVGIIVAFMFKNVVEENEAAYKVNPWADDDKTRQSFLPPDTFDKTKHQRHLEWLEAERLRQIHIEQLRAEAYERHKISGLD